MFLFQTDRHLFAKYVFWCFGLIGKIKRMNLNKSILKEDDDQKKYIKINLAEMLRIFRQKKFAHPMSV